MNHDASQDDCLPRVLYDGDCSLCRFFAGVAQKRAMGKLVFESWQDFSTSHRAGEALPKQVLESPSDKLRLFHLNTLLEDTAAWEWLLKEHPDLKGLGWLAEKMGASQAAAKLVGGSARTLKRFCYHCGRR